MRMVRRILEKGRRKVGGYTTRKDGKVRTVKGEKSEGGKILLY